MRLSVLVSAWVSVSLLVTTVCAPSVFAQAPGARPPVNGAPAGPGAAAPGARSTANGNQVSLNFKDADIDSVVGAFGHLLNRTFIIDPRVRGKLTLETPKPVSRDQAYGMLQAALRMQGFAVVESGTIAKVVPEADAKLQQGPVSAGPSNAAPRGTGDQVVTQIFRLQHESATNLVTVLRPLISPNNTVTAYPNNNSLVVTDYAANLQRIGRIIASLDMPSTSELEIVTVKHALASDLAVTLNRMLDDQARAGGGAPVDAGQRIVVLADPRTNTVMMRSPSAARLNLAKTLIGRLDQPSATPGNINVVYLRNAEAVRLAQVLRGVLSGGGESGFNAGTGTGGQSGFGATNTTGAFGGGVGGAGGIGGAGNQSPLGGTGNTPGNTPLQSSGGTGTGPVTVNAGGAIIAADPSTNSLIITAPEPLYRNLRMVIDRLDARRAQVYIESLIVEITSERAAELGIQWQMLNAPSGSTRVIGGTNLPARGTGANIIDVATNLGSLGTGLNIGVARGTVNVPGVGEVLNLGLLARALESNSSANILATPNLLTLDNEEARIIIGQNVPFVTGQFTLPSAGATATSPFQTVERKDVGTTLRVKPQVSESGTVRMQIFQEVSSVQDRTLSAGLITNRRAIESNVLVDDGQIVVLGGLIEERVEGGVEKVPGLGDVPVLGNLFRYDARKRVKTNLLVFLRPIVLRDARNAYDVTADRYDYIRAIQGDARLPQHWLLPDYKPGALPGMPTRPAAPTPRPNADGSPGTDPERGRPGALGEDAAPTRGPASLAPDVDRSAARPAPIQRARPTVIQRTPNEVIVPLGGQREDAPGGGAAPEPARTYPPAPNSGG